MAVPCPSCGREYDAALFAFGRTLSCACGARVGLEPRVRESAAPARLVADAMLGRLARWLRLLGFDCAFDADASDQELARRAVLERRILLTRDRRLPEEWWIPDVLVVRAEHTGAQLAEVIRRLELAASIRPLSRCSACNRALAPAAPSELAGRVPPRVLGQHSRFLACPGCGRVYWEGTHAERIRRVAEALAAPTRRGEER